MNNHASFRTGYIEGRKAILGNKGGRPFVPAAPSIPAGKTAHQVGLIRGIEVAKKRMEAAKNHKGAKSNDDD